MKTHNLVQGSPEWLAYRRQHDNASDAPAMLGVSPYKTRSALMRERRTGVAPEVGAQAEYLFARGHRFEASARAMAEAILEEDLFPVVASKGTLSASFDGITMDESSLWEHKMLNDTLRECFRQMEAIPEAMRAAEAGRLLPIYHRVQMEQQLHVSDAERVLFTASTWSDDGELVEAVHCWYYPDEELRAEILNGWAQFRADETAYVEPAAAPVAPTGRAPAVLPALRIEMAGGVKASNLPEFKAVALHAIRSVRRELATDQDFADAEASVKWCAEVETRLDAAKQHALAQTSTIDELFRTIDDISGEARRVRLELEKLVKSRKDAIREEIALAAKRALMAHQQALAAECSPAALNGSGLGDFAAAIKGKRTLQSLRDACDTELARSKMSLDDQARRIRANLATFKTAAAGREFLFSDLATLLHKAADDFGAAVRQRLADHEAEEAKRRAAETARIRAEEQARAQREAEEHTRAEIARLAKIEDYMEGIREGAADAASRKTSAEVREEIDYQIRIKTPTQERFQEFYDKAVGVFESTLTTMREHHAARLREEAAACSQVATPKPAPAPNADHILDRGESPGGQALVRAMAPPPAAAPAPVNWPFPRQDAAPPEPATLKLGTICERLGFTVSDAFLTELGHPPADTAKTAKLRRESDFPLICQSIAEHTQRAAARDWRAAVAA